MHNFLERTLKKIEREGNDDLLQVQSLGPQFYSTPELYRLLEELHRQRETVSAKLVRLYRVGILIPFCILGAFFSSYVKLPVAPFLCMIMVPIVGFLFTYRSIRIRKEHPTYYQSQSIEYKIRQELKRRREESSIF